ncbi:RNA polymerase sigma factor [Paraburkholderia caballeronis]|uniref:RNA polymerase sigma-70 factor, ECF subfamily n=1 Tax=Paraburkholderia caballeronis TaxID=416943 RepID=A0A1H7M1N7_9BURK|nr:RNA polymerase sigma factor [Paraburkholderia caballeronis]PXW28690.1 RNA polymerase sigma-70 factor (ECF subfamily) [Paraburkholderia caballeronis]PXX04056.1 RNA polymerase sigma-70 factor (ECF subfamily) [Paraburkholderia caballeronis]RAK04800.1 RNA polymerase sigma-70 factor (ECF subfamily) [Paraburkholderia caballeronis]TDV19701.1 RNA polymerase sigma-70 factor (ECF subfamily) [Paraburkholderia caballeronis]TDV22300.1 RNA polymerase sigma-70 factor (ECF subfamily) [Paraburkholderia caba
MNFVDELVNGYRELLRTLSRELNVDDAKDVAQSSFERALVYAQTHEVQSPRGLLFSIARGLRVDQLRRRSLVLWESFHASGEADEEPDEYGHYEIDPEQQAVSRQLLMKLCDVLDGLAPRCREAFVLCKLRGLSYEEAAAEMGVSAAVVHKYLMQAMRACREVTQS